MSGLEHNLRTGVGLRSRSPDRSKRDREYARRRRSDALFDRVEREYAINRAVAFDVDYMNAQIPEPRWRWCNALETTELPAWKWNQAWRRFDDTDPDGALCLALAIEEQGDDPVEYLRRLLAAKI